MAGELLYVQHRLRTAMTRFSPLLLVAILAACTDNDPRSSPGAELTAARGMSVPAGVQIRGRLGVIDTPLPTATELSQVDPQFEETLRSIANDPREPEIIRANALRVLGDSIGSGPMLAEAAANGDQPIALRVGALEGLGRQPASVLKQHQSMLLGMLIVEETPIAVAAGKACIRLPEARPGVRQALDSGRMHPAASRILDRALARAEADSR